MNMDEEDHRMTLLCSFLDSWDNLVMNIGRTRKTLVLDEVMVVLILEEVRWKSSKSTNDALDIHGRLKEKINKRENGRSKSHGRNKCPGKSKEKCWNYCKVEHFRGDWKEENKNNKRENNDFDGDSKKYSKGDGGYPFVVALETLVG
jgi:hypothetical protein